MQQIEAVFEEMGARAKRKILRPRIPSVQSVQSRIGASFNSEQFRIDILRDSRGEFFDLRHGSAVRLEIPCCNPIDKHLLLIAYRGQWDQPQTYLCGHDEKAWFVAAIPESASARDVQTAKDALKPREVWDAMRKFSVPLEQRDQRRTDAFVRQGEWFFIPCPGMEVPEDQVLRDEPIRRGSGKSHICQFMYQVGGTPVWVNGDHPNGLTNEEYMLLSPGERRMNWSYMRRSAGAFVRGSIAHPDHNTIWLTSWHRVVMNTETQARAMRHMAFLD